MSINLVLLLLLGFLLETSPAPTAPPPPVPVCDGIMADAGLTPSFAQSVAHRCHSLTLEDLRFYFQPEATEDNPIPTVNMDLSSQERVLPNAPLYGYDTAFCSVEMRHLDQVLRNMDRSEFGIKNYSILEQVAHVYHMGELWSRAKLHYDALSLLPPTEGVCECVRDMEQNGVIQELNLLALKIKYPGLTSGQPGIYNQVGAPGAPLPAAPAPADISHSSRKISKRDIFRPQGDIRAYEISYGLKSKRAETERFHRALRDFDFSGAEEDVVTRASQDLVDGDTGLAEHLDSQAGWEAWKEGFKAMEEQDNYEFAVFMYCMLK